MRGEEILLPLHPSRSPLLGEMAEDEAFFSREGWGGVFQCDRLVGWVEVRTYALYPEFLPLLDFSIYVDPDHEVKWGLYLCA